MLKSGITSKGQTTLPKAVREALGVKAGDRVRYVIHGEEARIRPMRPISRLFGVLRYDGPPISLEEMEQAIISGASEE